MINEDFVDGAMTMPPPVTQCWPGAAKQ